MLLTIDVGNSNTVLGVFDGSELRAHWRLTTRREQTADEYGILVRNLFAGSGLDPARVEAIALASVVPPLTPVLVELARRYLGRDPLVIGPGVKTGMPILYEPPSDVGADRIVNGVAAFATYAGPVIVVDFGTATTFDVITRRGEYAGSGKWRLVDVSQTLFGPAGPRTARSQEAEWRSAMSPDLLNVLIVVPERMSSWKLYKYTQHLAGNRQKTERYEIALWKKLFYPLATLGMMALALPFAYMHARSGMVGIKVFLGIMLGIFFHMLNSLFSHIGLLKQWPPVAAAAVPSLIFLATAVLMMLWIERVRPIVVRLRG